MAAKRKRKAGSQPARVAYASEVIATLEGMASKKVRDGMARYAIPSDHALGISVGALRQLGKTLGKSHELAIALWDSGLYEARMLASFVGEPERLTPAQMDRFCRDFDNWAITDTMCFALFDRTPHAFDSIKTWSTRSGEFQKRAAFALLASVALHDKAAPDARFIATLPLIERASTDDRNFVRKGVSWALRGIGGRNLVLHEAALKLAHKLTASSDRAARWIGKDAIRDLSRPTLKKKLRARAKQ
jgi:3-methyladenine DNA glycosylase AlkD